MWKVECSWCNEIIKADDPDEIKTDIDGNPRHDSCPYAEGAEYPVSKTIRTDSKYSTKENMKSMFPHLVPQIENGMEFPENFRMMGNHDVSYLITMPEGKDSIWEANVQLRSVDGEYIASHIPRVIYECEKCGTKVDGQVHYLTDGNLPFIHRSCPELTRRNSNAKFKPVELSNLDMKTPKSSEIIETYLDKYK